MAYAHALRACVQKTCGFESHSAHFIYYRGVAQSVERLVWDEEVPSSNLGTPTLMFWAHSSMVEQFPLKEKVEGSNPSGLTNFYRSKLKYFLEENCLFFQMIYIQVFHKIQVLAN